MAAKGLIHIYTGEGKGKTTAAIGLAVRAAGWGATVLFVQFFKEDSAASGEKEFFRRAGIELIRSNCRHPIFTKGRTDEAGVKAAIRGTFDAVKARLALAEGIPGLLVLDEVMAAIRGGWLSAEEVVELLAERPAGVEVVLTGRDAPVELMQVADYVTEMLKIKHPFDTGTTARKGVEY
ncbi:MAG: cob(I)yrinic acid a,c-diamide adenosyltransferase [Deltaproteobacteria bacterium]|nr:cob(I)yrinic acid a,c-diamide adenosyltransferase [Deltaproteobacteria bacterium]